MLIESGLDVSLVRIVAELSPKYELTPRGLVTLLMVLTDLV